MKHATTRMLFAHWDGLRGERSAPERSAVRPGALRHVVADTFILSREDGEPPSFRLAGTRVGALLGRDLRGKPFHGLWSDAERDDAERLLDLVLTEGSGVVAGVLGLNENGSELAMELVLLPLRHRGRPDIRLIGALSPAIVPSWAGLVPIFRLETRSVRIIVPGSEAARVATEPASAPAPERTGRRELFVVHDGGLA